MSSKKSNLVAGKPGQDPTLPRVPITLNGNEYHLVYDFNAIARAEELSGLNLFGSFDFSRLTATKFRAMLFASLLKENSKITLEECGLFITARNLADITIKMVEAWHGSRPELVEEGNAQAEGVSEAEAA